MRKRTVSFALPAIVGIVICLVSAIALFAFCTRVRAEETPLPVWNITLGDFSWENPGGKRFQGGGGRGFEALVVMFSEEEKAAPALSSSIERTKPENGRLCSDGFVHVGEEKYRLAAMAFGDRQLIMGRIIPAFLKKKDECTPVRVHTAEVNGKTYAVGFPEVCDNPMRLDLVEEETPPTSPPEKKEVPGNWFRT